MSPDHAGVTDAPSRPGESAGDEPEDLASVGQEHEPAPPPPVRDPAPEPVPTAPPLASPVLTTLEELQPRQQRRAARLRGRKVRRIIRRVDAWSVLKISFIFFVCIYVVTMVALLLLWKLASGTGVIDNIESFVESLGFEKFEFEPGKLLQGTALGGAVLTVLATGLTALGAVLFNLISDLVGGIRITMIEEPMAVPRARKRSGRTVRGSDTVDRPS